jgi:hypothetical protein
MKLQFTAVPHEFPVSNLRASLPDTHNKHSNIQYQFLSLCRLQQLSMSSRMTVVVVTLLLATLAVIFWLWLVIVPARVAILCPEDCRCDPGGYVICDDPSLISVSLIHLRNF